MTLCFLCVFRPYLKPETRLFATQQFEKMSDSVILEIQRGQGPFNRSIDSAVKIGDLISLTVHGKAATKGLLFVTLNSVYLCIY